MMYRAARGGGASEMDGGGRRGLMRDAELALGESARSSKESVCNK